MRRQRSRFASRKPNAPPPDQPWIWLTREMLESAAWRALSRPARGVIDRIVLEHLAHGGTQNGELTVTYDDFAAYGLSSRRMTAQAIRIAVALGFIDVTMKGRRSFGGARLPSQYGVTWLPRGDRTVASNRWSQIATDADAAAIVRASRASLSPAAARRRWSGPRAAA